MLMMVAMMINDATMRSLASVGLPAFKEPSSLTRQDGRRPYAMTLIPWQGGRLPVQDVTVASTLLILSAGRSSRLQAKQPSLQAANYQSTEIYFEITQASMPFYQSLLIHMAPLILQPALFMRSRPSYKPISGDDMEASILTASVSCRSAIQLGFIRFQMRILALGICTPLGTNNKNKNKQLTIIHLFFL